MKATILFVVGVLISLTSFSQNLKKNAQDPKGMILVPGSTHIVEIEQGMFRDVKVDDFWMSNEITNKEFRNFYEDLINNPNYTLAWVDLSKMKPTSDGKMTKPVVVKEAYKDIAPKIIDLSVSNSIPSKENYFTNSKYDNYPVVGVSYYGAMYYCIWRSNQEHDAKGITVQDYRLPTWFEWLNVPRANKNYEKGLHEVLKGEKNELGLFNLNGNVAEWTSSSPEDGELESKYVIGYSWKSDSNSQFTEQVPAEKATDYIGFRIVKSKSE